MNWTSQTVERLVFGPLIVIAYLVIVGVGVSGSAEKATEADTIIHDAMLTLGPIVGAVFYSVFGRPQSNAPSDPPKGTP